MAVETATAKVSKQAQAQEGAGRLEGDGEQAVQGLAARNGVGLQV
jgi:hypothetical protein